MRRFIYAYIFLYYYSNCFVDLTILLKMFQRTSWWLTTCFFCCSLCSLFTILWHTSSILLFFFRHQIVIPINLIAQPHIWKSKFPLLLIPIHKFTNTYILPTKNKKLKSSPALLAYNLSQWPSFFIFYKVPLGWSRSLYYHLLGLSSLKTL